MCASTIQLCSILFIFTFLLLDASFALTTSKTSQNSLASNRGGLVQGLLQSIRRQEEPDTLPGEDDDYYYNDTVTDDDDKNNNVDLMDQILVKPKDFYSQFGGINATNTGTSIPSEDLDNTSVPSMPPVGDISPAPSVQGTTGDNPLTFDPTISPTKTLTSSPPTMAPTIRKSPMPSVPITPNPTKSPTMAPTTESWSEKVKDEQERLKELANDRTAEVMAGILAFLGICGMLFTAYQLFESPDGLCASCCRLSLKVATFFLKIMCLPCRMCFGRYTGYTGSDPRNRTVFVEEYTNDLELT